MTPEGKVKELVKKLFKRYGVYYHMPVQNGMGKPSLDFVCCANGRFIAIETKAPKGKPSPRQVITMAEMEKAGAFVFLVDGPVSLLVVEAHLRIWGMVPNNETQADSGCNGRQDV